jgi:hypothetical protein
MRPMGMDIGSPNWMPKFEVITLPKVGLPGNQFQNGAPGIAGQI